MRKQHKNCTNLQCNLTTFMILYKKKTVKKSIVEIFIEKYRYVSEKINTCSIIGTVTTHRIPITYLKLARSSFVQLYFLVSMARMQAAQQPLLLM